MVVILHKITIVVAFFFVILFGIEAVAAEPYTVRTRHAKLIFQQQKDVREFYSEIDFSSGKRTKRPSNPIEYEYALIAKVDALFEKVQRILDMRKKMKRVNVLIVSNKKELHKVFEQIYGRECRLRGWYMFERNTVYLNVDDVHEGMLAHEFAHAIIDHFLETRPPRASAEILARFVDAHLFDKVKTY